MQAVDARDEAPGVQAINRRRESLVAVGFAPPTWEELVSEIARLPNVADGEPQPRVGWQANAAREVESSFLAKLSEVDFTRRKRRDAQVPKSRRRNEARYPELVGTRGKARLVVLAGAIGERFLDETANAVWHQLKCGTYYRSCWAEPTPRGCGGGVRFLHPPLLGYDLLRPVLLRPSPT